VWSASSAATAPPHRPGTDPVDQPGASAHDGRPRRRVPGRIPHVTVRGRPSGLIGWPGDSHHPRRREAIRVTASTAPTEQSGRTDRPTVAVLGTGIMGAAMARNLLRSGLGVRSSTRGSGPDYGWMSRGREWRASSGWSARGWANATWRPRIWRPSTKSESLPRTAGTAQTAQTAGTARTAGAAQTAGTAPTGSRWTGSPAEWLPTCPSRLPAHNVQRAPFCCTGPLS
jgi:hypothetical protein